MRAPTDWLLSLQWNRVLRPPPNPARSSMLWEAFSDPWPLFMGRLVAIPKTSLRDRVPLRNSGACPPSPKSGSKLQAVNIRPLHFAPFGQPTSYPSKPD
jgi:hypothetical protein